MRPDPISHFSISDLDCTIPPDPGQLAWPVNESHSELRRRPIPLAFDAARRAVQRDAMLHGFGRE